LTPAAAEYGAAAGVGVNWARDAPDRAIKPLLELAPRLKNQPIEDTPWT